MCHTCLVRLSEQYLGLRYYSKYTLKKKFWEQANNALIFLPFRTVQRHLDIIKVFIYSPTDAPVSCLKNNIKIYIKTAPTLFGVTVTPSSWSALICAY